MKKHLPLAIATAALCLSANAKQISIQQAETVARKYIATQSSQKKLRHVGQQATAPYYAFNSDKGFVVVSGDDSLTELVCYSDHGTFDAENLPEPLKELLDGYAGYVKAVQNGTAKAVRTETSSDPTVIVSPMVTTKWNQSEPYNEMTPNNCPTGCAATALAQVMNYHEWPVTGTGSNTYTHSTYGEISVDFSQSTYDWDNMLDEYTEGAYTDEQANAVAKLMYDCGVALNMNYGPSSSGASTYAYRKCATFFKYNVDIISRDNRSTADNIKLVTDELNDGRPFIIAAHSLSGGHAFVADGYDSNNFLHINWGWGGLSDAYFNLNYLDPASQGIGGGSGAYNRYQSFIFFTPLRNGETPEGNTSLGYLTRDGAGVGCTSTTFDKSEQAPFTLTYIYNNGSKDFAGNIALGIFDSSNNLVTRSESADFPDDNPFKSGYYFTDVANFPIDLSSLADGSYTAHGIYRLSADGDDETKWNNFNSKSALTVTISGDNVAVAEVQSHLALSESIAMSGNLGLGHIISFSANLINDSSITVDGYINYAITKKSDGSIVKSSSEKAIIYDGSDYNTKVNVYLSEDKFEPGETYVFSINGFTTTNGEAVTMTNDYGDLEFSTTTDEPLAQKRLTLITYSGKEAKVCFSDDQFSTDNSTSNLTFGFVANLNTNTFVGQIGYMVNKFKGDNVYSVNLGSTSLESYILFTSYISTPVYSSPIASITDNGIYSIFAATAEQIDDAYPDEMVKFANADDYRLDFRFTDGIITQLHPETTVKQSATTTVTGSCIMDIPVTFTGQLENMNCEDVDGEAVLGIYDKDDQLITSISQTVTIPAYGTAAVEFPCALSSTDFNEGETYTVRISDFSNSDGYSFTASTDYDFTFHAATSGVGTMTSAAVKVYPNPAVDVINTTVVADRIAVYSISGALVAEAANADSISVANLSTGCYIVAVTANGNTTRHQVLKK